MQITLWGCRGSIPVSTNAPIVREKIVKALAVAASHGLTPQDDIEAFIDKHLPFSVRGSYGSNTCSVQVACGHDEYLLIDCGSGLRDFGNAVMAERQGAPAVFNILMTHLHWDHLMGFPFFVPAYVPGNTIRFWGYHEDMEYAFRTQQSAPFFPVDFGDMGASIEFHVLDGNQTMELCGVNVSSLEQDHPGRSYGYRFEAGGKAFVFSTDSEHRASADEPEYPFLDFIRNVDMLVFDAQYTFRDANTNKQDWGHSNNVIGVELAKRAGVRRLCLFHQEPTLDDASLQAFHEETKNYERLFMPEQELEILMAYDGMVVHL